MIDVIVHSVTHKKSIGAFHVSACSSDPVSLYLFGSCWAEDVINTEDNLTLQFKLDPLGSIVLAGVLRTVERLGPLWEDGDEQSNVCKYSAFFDVAHIQFLPPGIKAYDNNH